MHRNLFFYGYPLSLVSFTIFSKYMSKTGDKGGPAVREPLKGGWGVVVNLTNGRGSGPLWVGGPKGHEHGATY